MQGVELVLVLRLLRENAARAVEQVTRLGLRLGGQRVNPALDVTPHAPPRVCARCAALRACA